MISSARTVTPNAAVSALERRRNFLSEVVIDYGPRDVLGRLFLKADTELRELGIELSFAPVEAMLELNRVNRNSWRPLVPILDATIGGYNADTGFCVLGRNRDGEIIAAHGARLYEMGPRTFKEEGESLRLWYPNPERTRAPGESCTITCPSADKLTGRAVFSGGVWFRPDYRKVGLTTILGRVVKAYAFTRWYSDIVFTMMIDDVFAGGTAKRAGYTHAEWEVDLKNTPLGTFKLALLWITAAEQLEYFDQYLARPHAQVDARVEDRTANQNRRA